ncbi:ROK family transcriptional regulator [Arthrobacter sp. R4-81]
MSTARLEDRPTPGRVGDVRKQNLALVLRNVQPDVQTTRAQLAAETGLTKASVSSLVADLLGAGLLTEVGITRDGERGRPGVALALNPLRGALGAEVNVDYLGVGVVDLNGNLHFQETVERHNSGSSPEDVLRALRLLTTRAADAASDAGILLLGGGLAVPGLVDADRNYVATAPNLGWTGVELSGELEALLPHSPFGVTLSNEANSAALAELWYGQGASFRAYLYISGEVGVGGGLIIDSRLFTGPAGHAGEIGHTVVQPKGPKCTCGGQGCLETFAGQEAIFSASGIGDGPTGHRMAQLLAALADGESRALAAVEEAGYYLGVATATTARLMNVAAVVLGGHFAVLEEWIRPALQRSLDDFAPGVVAADAVAFSSLRQTAALMGAAGSCLRRVLANPQELFP